MGRIGEDNNKERRCHEDEFRPRIALSLFLIPVVVGFIVSTSFCTQGKTNQWRSEQSSMDE